MSKKNMLNHRNLQTKNFKDYIDPFLDLYNLEETEQQNLKIYITNNYIGDPVKDQFFISGSQLPLVERNRALLLSFIDYYSNRKSSKPKASDTVQRLSEDYKHYAQKFLEECKSNCTPSSLGIYLTQIMKYFYKPELCNNRAVIKAFKIWLQKNEIHIPSLTNNDKQPITPEVSNKKEIKNRCNLQNKVLLLVMNHIEEDLHRSVEELNRTQEDLNRTQRHLKETEERIKELKISILQLTVDI